MEKLWGRGFRSLRETVWKFEDHLRYDKVTLCQFDLVFALAIEFCNRFPVIHCGVRALLQYVSFCGKTEVKINSTNKAYEVTELNLHRTIPYRMLAKQENSV